MLKIGGNENAFTSTDYTGYFQRVPRDQLGTMMEFEADRMTGLILKDENVLPERDVVLEEYNMRVANNPEARLTEQIMAALYLNHPYGRPVIGWHQEIEKLDREDALAFYKRFYAPNNATLVIAGDVDEKDVRPMVERTFGPVPPQPSIPARRLRPQEPTPVAPRTVTLADPRVEQPSMKRYYLVPSATTAAAGESPALDVLAQLMGTAAIPTCIARWWSTSRSRSVPTPDIRAPRSTPPNSSFRSRPSPASISPRSNRWSTM